MRHFTSSDGEATIMSGLARPEVAEAFALNRVDAGRVGAASTGQHNACDRSLLFRKSKREVYVLTKNCVDCRNDNLRAGLAKMWTECQLQFNNVRPTALAREHTAQSLEILVRAYQQHNRNK